MQNRNQEEPANPVAAEQKLDNVVFNDGYYESEKYQQLIPSQNTKWIYSPLAVNKLLINVNNDDDFCIDKLDIDQNHKYYDDIKQSLDLFKEWNSWQVTENVNDQRDNVWKSNNAASSVNPDDLNICWNSKQIDITKSTMVFPFSSAVIAGIFCNNEHYAAIDEQILCCKVSQTVDNNSCIVYVEQAKPMVFSRNRDLLMIRFCYILENGSFIFGEKSIDDKDSEHDQQTANNVLRADIINLWHVVPVGDDYNQSVITHFCRYDPRGNIGKLFLPALKMEKAKFLSKLYEYLRDLQNILHTQGQLYIPSKLFDIMDIGGSLRKIGELQKDGMQEKKVRRLSDDDHIIDINLAVASVITDVRDFFNDLGTKN